MWPNYRKLDILECLGSCVFFCVNIFYVFYYSFSKKKTKSLRKSSIFLSIPALAADAAVVVIIIRFNTTAMVESPPLMMVMMMSAMSRKITRHKRKKKRVRKSKTSQPTKSALDGQYYCSFSCFSIHTVPGDSFTITTVNILVCLLACLPTYLLTSTSTLSSSSYITDF